MLALEVHAPYMSAVRITGLLLRTFTFLSQSKKQQNNFLGASLNLPFPETEVSTCPSCSSCPKPTLRLIPFLPYNQKSGNEEVMCSETRGPGVPVDLGL